MLTRNLISASIPALHSTDKLYHAQQLMNDYHVAHLPVLEGDKYLGVVSEEQLLAAEDDTAELAGMHISDGGTAVQATDHFLKALQTAVQNSISTVPVLEGKEYIGIVSYTDLLRTASQFMSLSDPGALIVLEMDARNYSFGELSRLVESNDAQITQLNSNVDPETGMMEVTLRVSKLEISDIIATLQRFEYNVKYYFGEELYENELRGNYDNLMHYLRI